MVNDDLSAECTHHWETCPVHSQPGGAVPSMRVALTCIYGGTATKAGTPWDEQDSDEVTDHILARLERWTT